MLGLKRSTVERGAASAKGKLYVGPEELEIDCLCVAYHSKGPAILTVDVAALEDDDFHDPYCDRQDHLGAMHDQLVERDFVMVELDHLDHRFTFRRVLLELSILDVCVFALDNTW